MSIVLDGSNVSTTGVPNSGTAVASTSGTSIDFTGIPAGTKRITVMWSGLSTNGTSKKLIQLGTGTTTYTTSGYLCSSCSMSSSAASGENSTTGFMFSRANGAADIDHGLAIITNLTGNTWSMSSNSGLSSGVFETTCAGSIALGAVLTAVRITTANGTDTFDAGSINILYE